MSHLATICVFYRSNLDISVTEILEMFISNGWNLNDSGHISFRPLGDKDDFDWHQLDLDQKDQLYSIIQRKVVKNEDPGVVLYWEKTEVGVITTFFPKEKRISFLLLENRMHHPDYREWTDVSRYLSPILNPLVVNKIVVTQIEFSEMA